MVRGCTDSRVFMDRLSGARTSELRVPAWAGYGLAKLQRRAAVRAVLIGPPADYLHCKCRWAKAPPFAGNWKPKRVRLHMAEL
jgi:hypothetical protein